MSDKILLHEIVGSPNNIKVRLAMNYKGIPFDRKPVEILFDKPISQWERTAIRAATRQPLTPSIEHGKIKMFDSSAILRYLEANFPETKPIFSENYDQMKTIETWEMFGRINASEPMGIIFGQAMSPEKDNLEIKRANDLFEKVTAKIEDQLQSATFLAGSELTAADIVVAPYVSYGALTEERAVGNPIASFFFQNLKMRQGREKTLDWIGRVMSYDS